MHAVVQVPAYREGDQFPEVLAAIREQDVDGHDVDVEAWVTLSPPGTRADCTTWQDAASVDGVTVHEAPEGKLSARNAAHEHAIEAGADAIVSWDADAYPRDDRVLASLLEPLEGDDVVVANSTPLAAPFEGNLLATLVDVAGAAEDRVRPHVHGQCHAMTAAAWEQLGPFDESIDQTNVSEVRAEEEFGFYHEAERAGAVVEPDGAVISNDTRRHRCRIQSAAHLGGGRGSFCASREQAVTFEPKRGMALAASDRRGSGSGAGCGCGGR